MTDAFGFPRTALVLGGASEIAHATLVELSRSGLEAAVLAVRSTQRASAWIEQHPLPDLDVHLVGWDAGDVEGHEPLFDRAAELLGDIDLVLCAVGSLGHGAGLTAKPEEADHLFQANMAGPATALTAAARRLDDQGRGAIVVLSSVAGLRPRKSNYLYGAAKAGLDTFTQGLADALADGPVRVHLIRPGFVTSKMTAGLDPAPFATTPDVVAAAIADALTSPGNRIVHVPRILGPLFLGFRNLPRPLWRRIAGDR